MSIDAERRSVRNGDLHPSVPSPDAADAAVADVVDVSVVIINKDERSLAGTLAIIHDEVRRVAFAVEVIVVDASEGRLDDIRDAAPWARWIAFRPLPGVSISIPHQRNTGVRAAAGRIVAFCDSGGEPSPEWLSSLVAPLLDGRQSASCGPVESIRSSVYRIANDLPDGAIPSAPPTANMAFTRLAFDAVGGFDETFRYGSDVDFAWRLEDAGMPVRQVRAAVMRMDWGDRRRQNRRSRWYGSAQARLWLKHPRRWGSLPRTSPVLLLYPAWLLAVVPAAAQALRRRPALLIGWLLAPLGLAAKNRRQPQPLEVVRQNVLFGLGALGHVAGRVAGRLVRRRPTVLFVPKEQGAYQGGLLGALQHAGLDADYFGETTRSQTLNLALLPLTTLLARLGGARIVHVHWTYGFVPRWAYRVPGARLASRLWFTMWLRWCRAIGMQVVWSAHNLLPHYPLFDDDGQARRDLVRHSAAVIALNSYGAGEVQLRWAATCDLIPIATVELPEHGTTRVPGSVGRAAAVGWFGQVERYKGVGRLLGAAMHLPDVHFTVCGSCAEATLHGELVDRWSATPGNVDWIDRRVTDDELAELCATSDLLVFPFARVTNSASVYTAMSTGCPVAVPDLPAFAELPSDACVRFAASSTDAELAAVIAAFMETSDTARCTLGAAGREYARSVSWEEIAMRHLDVYRRILDPRRRAPQRA